ncbi:CHAT domain-containing protein [Iningainema tapete]|uniref:CHAT domain-containing protein n=1 Tax=Iningainema tapete BLCC-T55 TaxID=2748662 RepID=A0A8J7CI34_9CYAN|nr:CHAT domain-containing protein [Iningainema tapete BLCC-T55]
MCQQGKSPTAALRTAQLSMWQQQKWHHPYYWSAFTFGGWQ